METITPTWEGDRAWASMPGESELLGRVWACPEVTVPGPDGRPVAARARILTGAEAEAAARRFATRHPLRHAVLRFVRRSTPVHLELRAR